MKLGVLTVLLGNRSLKETCEYLAGLGVETVEIGCGGFPGKAHCDPEKLLADEGEYERFITTIMEAGLEVSALSCHGNMVHPNSAVAEKDIKDFENAVLLAEKMGLDTIITFSGCPGDCSGSQYPNWVTCAWPDDFQKILDWQWNEVLIPFWKKTVEFARAHGVTKIALEMHPGFAVYNTNSLLKLRQAVGPEIGANFDPSHLIWQGMDPAVAVRELAGAMFHFHAKDTKLDEFNTARKGVLDLEPYTSEATRSWIFRTVGYGLNESKWREIMSMLALIGYDGAISVEHEDSLMAPEEGLEKAVAFLKRIIIKKGKPTDIWWA